MLPRLNKAIPAPLVAIVVLTALAVWRGLDVPAVADMDELPDALPVLGIPDVPFTFETLAIIAPVAVTLAFIPGTPPPWPPSMPSRRSAKRGGSRPRSSG